MINSKHTLVFLSTILLGAGSMAVASAADPNPRPAPEAREITEPTHETFGDYVVHYTAQMTTMVPAEVARALDITRGEDRAMLNVAVLRQGDAEAREPLPAEIEVDAVNLAGQLQNIPIRKVRDGESIYYIGEFRIADEEIMTFDIRVRPDETELAHEFSFQQQFFTD